MSEGTNTFSLAPSLLKSYKLTSWLLRRMKWIKDEDNDDAMLDYFYERSSYLKNSQCNSGRFCFWRVFT